MKAAETSYLAHSLKFLLLGLATISNFSTRRNHLALTRHRVSSQLCCPLRLSRGLAGRGRPRDRFCRRARPLHDGIGTVRALNIITCAHINYSMLSTKLAAGPMHSASHIISDGVVLKTHEYSYIIVLFGLGVGGSQCSRILLHRGSGHRSLRARGRDIYSNSRSYHAVNGLDSCTPFPGVRKASGSYIH